MQKRKDGRKLVVCAIIFILMSVSVAPSIYAEINNQTVQTISDKDLFGYDSYTPIQLVFLLLNKLRNYEGIESIESEEDVSQIIESDAELNGIIVSLKSYSCGCENGLTFEQDFTVICNILLLLLFYHVLTMEIIGGLRNLSSDFFILNILFKTWVNWRIMTLFIIMNLIKIFDCPFHYWKKSIVYSTP